MANETDQYLLDSHQFFTVAQMAEVLGVSDKYIYAKCEHLGIHPITPWQQKIEYIKAHCHRQTVRQLADKTELTQEVVQTHLLRLGLKALVEKETIRLSVRDVLSEYMNDYRHHWVEKKELNLIAHSIKNNE